VHTSTTLWHTSAQTKVRESNVSIAVQQDVLQLEIAVDETILVQGLQCNQNLRLQIHRVWVCVCVCVCVFEREREIEHRAEQRRAE
jgi:hypothetical protein